MDGSQRGNLFLRKIPNPRVEKKIISYLVNLRQGSSPDIISAKVKKAPVVLFKDISAQRGLMIAADLQRLGALAEFVPIKDEDPSRNHPPFSDATKPQRSQKSRASSSTRPKPKKWGRLIFLLLLLSFALIFLVWQNYSFFSAAYNQYFRGKNPKPYQNSHRDFEKSISGKEKDSILVVVPPQDEMDSK